MNQKCSVLRTDLWNLQHGLCHWQTGAMLRGCWVKLWRESYGNRMKTKRMMLIFRARAWKEFLRKNGFSTYLRCHLVLRIGVVYEIVKSLLYFSKDELGEERQQHKWCFQQLSHEPYRGWLRRYDIRELKKKVSSTCCWLILWGNMLMRWRAGISLAQDMKGDSLHG